MCEIWRGSYLESVHSGTAVICDKNGEISLENYTAANHVHVSYDVTIDSPVNDYLSEIGKKHVFVDLKAKSEGIIPIEEFKISKEIDKLKKLGYPVTLAGDVVGTGSSRKSATNSVLWHMGEDIPFIPNKKTGGICIGSKIAPIFFNTMQDAGTLVFEVDVDKLSTGDLISIYPYEGVIKLSLIHI